MCEDSEVCKHLLNNPNDEINFNSPKILDRSNHVTKLRIKDTLHISKTEPQLNVDQSIFASVSFQCLIALNCCLKMTSLFGCVFLGV